MVRTQIQLSEAQHRQVKEEARRRGVSMSELIRICVDNTLKDAKPDRAELYRRAWAIVGAFTDPEGKNDWSVNHDEYLDEAYS